MGDLEKILKNKYCKRTVEAQHYCNTSTVLGRETLCLFDWIVIPGSGWGSCSQTPTVSMFTAAWMHSL